MTIKTKYQCVKCLNLFSAKGGNYKRHIQSCDGSYRKPGNRGICKYCKEKFDISDKPLGWMANHTRWCDKNPKRKEYADALRARDNTAIMCEARRKTGRTNQYTAAMLDGKEVPESPMKGKPGTFLGRTHTEKSKQLMKEKALASPHRRLRKGMVEYKGIMLDSSWELELAKRLDELEIEWIRPEPIKWIDAEGITHNYFGDFYLTEHDLYLDPKNPQAIRVQKEKLDCLLTQHKNIIIIDSLENCKTFAL